MLKAQIGQQADAKIGIDHIVHEQTIVLRIEKHPKETISWDLLILSVPKDVIIVISESKRLPIPEQSA